MRDVTSRAESETKYWAIEFVLVAALLALGTCWRHGERIDWWGRLSPFAKGVVEGILLLSLGGGFLWNRSNRGAWFPTSVWDLRLFLFDVAFVIGGLACLVEALRLR